MSIAHRRTCSTAGAIREWLRAWWTRDACDAARAVLIAADHEARVAVALIVFRLRATRAGVTLTAVTVLARTTIRAAAPIVSGLRAR